MRIPLSAPDINEDDIEAVVGVLRSGRLSLGPKLEELEAAVAGYARVPYGVALSSGTAGLHLGLAALGIGEGDEVILPSFTFIAAANAVLYRRAKPVFADIDPRTLNLTPESVERAITPRTRAVIVVHTFGCPADLDPILELAARHRVKVIEDACEALGAEYRGKRIGGFGDLGVFAFYPNKSITTGEGGMVVTRDGRLAETIRALRNQGRRPADGWLDHSLLGYNYRISEINCALGLSQMQRIDAILARRQNRAACYREHLEKVPELTLPLFETAEGRVGWFVFVVRLAAHFAREDRDAIFAYMTARGIGCGRYFAPVDSQPLYAAYADRGRDLTVTGQVAPRTLALPFFNRLTDGEIAEVSLTLREAIATVQDRLST
ncbi:MAG: DegT/DnrJ/EryC1/StrS family aminotransferase [Bryobacteraceae bacterium]|jgi:perosamine synthetase